MHVAAGQLRTVIGLLGLGYLPGGVGGAAGELLLGLELYRFCLGLASLQLIVASLAEVVAEFVSEV